MAPYPSLPPPDAIVPRRTREDNSACPPDTLGSSLGLLLGLASTRILGAIVYGARTSDPLVVIAVVLTMLATGLLSAALPARRALHVEPASLLRQE